MFFVPVFALATQAMTASEPPTRLMPAQWIVVGPFDNPAVVNPAPDQPTRGGFLKDYLEKLGGEAQADLSKAIPMGSRVHKVEPGPQGRVDFKALFEPSDSKVAYAFGFLESPQEQDVTVRFGSDDSARIWIGGKLVHSLWSIGRGATPGQDTFRVRLAKGSTPVLVKVENAAGGWEFYFDAVTDEGLMKELAANATQKLPEQKIAANNGGSPLLVGNDFPQLVWTDLELLAPHLKSPTLRTVWYDEKLDKVETASKPGSYLAYVEADLANGQTLKRILAFYKPKNLQIALILRWPPSGLAVAAEVAPPGVSKEAWDAVRPWLSGEASQALLENLARSDSAAALFAYLDALTDGAAPAKSPAEPRLALLNLQLSLKAKMYDLPYNNLKLVREAKTPARTLQKGTEAQAGVKPGTAAKLDELCKEWSKAEGKPFTALVARRGYVFFQGGYGELGGKATPPDAPFYPASIGKIATGLVFSMFLDQGFLDPDQPIGTILPDFPTEGPRAITFRSCFTHLSGMPGHGTYDGLWNPMLDNAFAACRFPLVTPMTRHEYGGDGNNLAAKAMELWAGRPFLRILQDSLYEPLEAKVDQTDMGWITSTTPMDLAKVGQLMLNRGSYGKHFFFSPETFEKMLPVRLKDFNPDFPDEKLEWGFALTRMFDPDSATGETNPLGPNVFGHGSASSSILRVDLDHDLLIVMGRYDIGNAEAYNAYRERFTRALREALVD